MYFQKYMCNGFRLNQSPFIKHKQKITDNFESQFSIMNTDIKNSNML